MIDRIGIAQTAEAMGVTRRTLERWMAETVRVPGTAERLLWLYTARPELLPRKHLRDATPCRIVDLPTDVDSSTRGPY
jgi:transcriptional regulator with XRE-family HTH domain